MNDRAGWSVTGLALVAGVGVAILLVLIGRAAADVEDLHRRLDGIAPQVGKSKVSEGSRLTKEEEARLAADLAALKTEADKALDAVESRIRIAGPDGKPLARGGDLKAAAAKAYDEFRAEQRRQWSHRQVMKQRGNAELAIKSRAQALNLTEEQQEKAIAALHEVLAACEPVMNLEVQPDDMNAWKQSQLNGFEEKMRSILTPDQYKQYSRHKIDIIGGMLFDSLIPQGKNVQGSGMRK